MIFRDRAQEILAFRSMLTSMVDLYRRLSQQIFYNADYLGCPFNCYFVPNSLDDLDLDVVLSESIGSVFNELTRNDNWIRFPKHYPDSLQFSNALFDVPSDDPPSVLLVVDRSVSNARDEGRHKPSMVENLPVHYVGNGAVGLTRQQSQPAGRIHGVALQSASWLVLGCGEIWLWLDCSCRFRACPQPSGDEAFN